MNFFPSIAFCFLFTLALVQAIRWISGGRKSISGKLLPPGPTPLPIIGNLLNLGDQPHKSLAKLASTYGPLMSLKLGSITTVVISSAPLAKEVLQKHDLTFSNRKVIEAIRALDHDQVSMIWLPVATKWRNLRKICNSCIFSTQKLDANKALRRNKVQELLAYVQARCITGQPVNIGQAAFRTTLGAVSNTILSLDMSNWDLDEVKEFEETARRIMDEVGKPNLGDYFPLIRTFDLQGIRGRNGIYFQKVFDAFDKVINERLQSRKLEGYVPVNDMLDTLLTFNEENSQEMDVACIKHLFLENSSLAAKFKAEQTKPLEIIIKHLQCRTYLLLGLTQHQAPMTELLRKPNTLAKARAELEQKIDKGRMVQESDIAGLPYLQAIIKETFRLHPAAPLLVPREAGADVELCGFTIPKGAQVLVNAWAIGRDPSSWENPKSFTPERFLGSGIDIGGQNFELIPFGGGRRICPGFPLAMRMIQLMLGSLIHTFDWKLEDGVNPENLDMEEKYGITLAKAQPLKAVPIQI